MPRTTIAFLKARIAELEENYATMSRIKDEEIASITQRNKALDTEAHLLSQSVVDLKKACTHFKGARDFLAGYLEAYLLQEDMKLEPIIQQHPYEGMPPTRIDQKVDRPEAMNSVPMVRVPVSSKDMCGDGHRQHYEDRPLDWENIQP